MVAVIVFVEFVEVDMRGIGLTVVGGRGYGRG